MMPTSHASSFHCMQVVARVMHTLQLQSDALHEAFLHTFEMHASDLIPVWLASG